MCYGGGRDINEALMLLLATELQLLPYKNSQAGCDTAAAWCDPPAVHTTAITAVWTDRDCSLQVMDSAMSSG